MRLKGKMMIGTGLVLLIFAAGFIFYEMNKTDEGNSAARSQSDSQQNNVEKGDNTDNGADTSESKQSTDDIEALNKQNNAQDSTITADNIGETGTSENGTASGNGAAPAAGSTGTTGTTESSGSVTPNSNQSTGLHFATREEAVAFGFSRFTQEEIALYNKASANGLTPEQQEMAIQMAYSRFSPEEVAALEEALGR